MKRNLCIFKCFIDVLKIFLFGDKEKLQNVPRFGMDFVLNFAMCSAEFTCVNGSTIRIVFCELFFGLTFWNLNKNFQETASLPIVLNLFIHKISSKRDCDYNIQPEFYLNASHIHYTHRFLWRCQVQVLDTFWYAANEFYSKIFFTVYSRHLT